MLKPEEIVAKVPTNPANFMSLFYESQFIKLQSGNGSQHVVEIKEEIIEYNT